MYLIVGLGNPEEEYSRTRHNIGFDAVNKISSASNIKIDKKKFNSLYGRGKICGEDIILLKPQTYMNLSGEAVRNFKNFFKLNETDIIVIYDDLDLTAGSIKIRKKGGPGTHNGMKSVVSEMKTENFPRIRIGIGEPPIKGDLINYLLTKIPEEEYKILENSTQKTVEIINNIITVGIDKAMNKYN